MAAALVRLVTQTNYGKRRPIFDWSSITYAQTQGSEPSHRNVRDFLPTAVRATADVGTGRLEKRGGQSCEKPSFKEWEAAG